MSDYRIKVGTELDTSGINQKIKGYKGDITVGSTLDTGGITKVLNGYKPKALDINTKLSTTGITTALKKYKANDIRVKVDPTHLFDGVETQIAAKTFKTPLKVGVQLNWAGVAKEIANPSIGKVPNLNIGVELNDSAIDAALEYYKKNNASKKIELKIKPVIEQFNLDQVETLLENYTARTPLKVNVELLKGRINDQIKEYNQTAQSDNGRTVLLRARLTDNAVSEAISNYKTGNAEKLKIPIDLTFNGDTKFDAELKQRIKLYENTPVEMPVKLKPAQKGFSSQITKLPVYVDAVLKNVDDINKTLNAYTNNPAPVAVRLVRGKGFDSEITKTPIKVQATLDPDNINTAINGFVPSAKMKVGVELKPTDVNTQVRKLPLPTEPISVGVELNETSVNSAIALFKPKATLGVKPDLIIEDVEEQIRAYVPKEKVKVHLDLLDSDINAEAGKYNSQNPITVNVKLDREKINQQIRDFKTSTKIKVGVDLDFKSHKDEAGKEIQKGIAKQIKEYSTKTKVKVGVELDRNSISQEVQNVHVDTPIRLRVEIDPESIKNIENRVNSLRQRLQEIGNINVNIGGNRVSTGIGGSEGQDIQTVRIARGVDDVTRAYRELLSIQNRMSSKQQAVAKLDTTKNKQEILELSKQIDELARKYQRIHQLFSGQFSSAQVDALNRNFEITAEKLSVIRQKALDAKDGLDRMGTSGDVSTTNGASGNTRRQVDETTQAYRELMGVLNELDSKKLQLNRLTASSPQSSNEIQRLRLQIEQLDNEYDNLLRSFNSQGIQFTPDQWNQLETVMARVGRQIDVIQAKMSDKSAIQSQTQAYRELLSISKEIGSLETNITKLKGQGGNANQIEVLENQLRTLQSTYQQLVTSMKAPLTSDQWSVIYTQIAQTSDKIEQLKAKYIDTRTTLASKITSSFGDYDNQVLSLRNRFDALANKTPEISISIESVRQALESLKTADGTEDIIVKNEKYKEVLKQVQAELTKLETIEKGANAQQSFAAAKEAAMRKLSSLFEEGSAAAKKYSGYVEQLRNELNSCGNIQGVQNVTKKINALGAEIRKTSEQTKTFSTRLKEQFSKYSSYLSVASLFMYASQGLRNMFEQVKLIDSAMTELKKVTDETDASYNNFLKNAGSRAKELGTTIDGLVSSAADFARLGYGFEDSQKLAEVANIYAVVGDEIEGVEGATESLISTLAAFKDEASGVSDADFAMDIIDIFNELGNKFAISSGGLGEALERSASSLQAANNTIHESAALITAANTVVQNPEKVGKWLCRLKKWLYRLKAGDS